MLGFLLPASSCSILGPSPAAYSAAVRIESDLIWFRYRDKTVWIFKISKIEEEEGLRSHCVVSMARHTIHTIPNITPNETIKNERVSDSCRAYIFVGTH